MNLIPTSLYWTHEECGFSYFGESTYNLNQIVEAFAMRFFIKKLGSNESGYSGDIPNQRGKFILIPKSEYDFFPPHSTAYLNDMTIVNFITPQGFVIPRKYDWHNAKFHLSTRSDLNRDHDEKRLYRSNSLDNALQLDRNVFFICAKHADGEYCCFAIRKNDALYGYLSSNYDRAQVTSDKKIEDHYNSIFKNVYVSAKS